MLQSAWLSKGRTEERVSVAARLGRGVGRHLSWRHPSALRLLGEATSAAGCGRAPGGRSPGRRPPGCRASLDGLGRFAAGYQQPALGVSSSAHWLRRRAAHAQSLLAARVSIWWESRRPAEGARDGG